MPRLRPRRVCVSTIQKVFTTPVKCGVISKSYQAADIFDVRNKEDKLCSVEHGACPILLQ